MGKWHRASMQSPAPWYVHQSGGSPYPIIYMLYGDFIKKASLIKSLIIGDSPNPQTLSGWRLKVQGTERSSPLTWLGLSGNQFHSQAKHSAWVNSLEQKILLVFYHLENSKWFRNCIKNWGHKPNTGHQAIKALNCASENLHLSLSLRCVFMYSLCLTPLLAYKGLHRTALFWGSGGCLYLFLTVTQSPWTKNGACNVYSYFWLEPSDMAKPNHKRVW